MSWKIKWFEPRYKKWFIYAVEKSEASAFQKAQVLENEGKRVQIMHSDAAIYTSNVDYRIKG